MTIFDLNKQVQAFDLMATLADAVKEAESEIVDANREQLYAGFKADGSSITPEYTPYTVKRKNDKGQVSNHVTLKDTGEFYKGLKIEIKNNDFEIVSPWSKFNELRAKYGNEITGLDQIDMAKITDEKLTPFVTTEFQKVL
jgi:hypothetical protein